MRFTLTMKHPDAMANTLANLAEEDCTPTELAKAERLMNSVLDYGEYLTIEIDTVLGTFTVILV